MRASVPRFLETRLRLRVNRAKSAVARPVERKFLGYRLIRNKGQVKLGIAPESLKRAKDTIRRITKRDRGVRFEQVLVELRTFTDGWVTYFRYAETPSVFQVLDQWIRRRLRCFQWKQWKTPRHRARQLLRAGVGPWLAWGVAVNGPGPWRVAGSAAMNRGLPNARLVELGFHSLSERYRSLAAG